MPHPQYSPEELATEQWLPVVGYEGRYEVSTLGRVRRDGPNRGGPYRAALHTAINTAGYLTVKLSRDRYTRNHYMIHRLVAIAFLGAPPMGHEVNHKDSDRLNPRLENLEWVTPKQNIRHAMAKGSFDGRPNAQGEAHGHSSLTTEQVLSIRALRGQATQEEIARMFGTTQSNVSAILLRKAWKHLS